MLPASLFWKITALALLVIWNTFFAWETAELGCFWLRNEYCLNKNARNTQGLAKKSYKYF